MIWDWAGIFQEPLYFVAMSLVFLNYLTSLSLYLLLFNIITEINDGCMNNAL